MAQEVTNKEIGTCIWFKNDFGYIGYGVFTNNCHEGQIYVHYKNINKKNLRNKKYREIFPNDVCEFEFGEGYYCDGTQALEVTVIKNAEL